jgi:hypothetical protein
MYLSSKPWSRQSIFDDKSTVAGFFFEKSTAVFLFIFKVDSWSTFSMLQDLGSATESTVDFDGIFWRFWGHFVQTLPFSHWNPMKNPQQNPRKIDCRLVATVAFFFWNLDCRQLVNFWNHSRQYGQLSRKKSTVGLRPFWKATSRPAYQ